MMSACMWWMMGGYDARVCVYATNVMWVYNVHTMHAHIHEDERNGIKVIREST